MSPDQPAPQPDEKKLSAAIALTMFFAGIGATFFAMDLYDSTFLPLKIALAIFIVPGIVITVLFFRVQLPQKYHKPIIFMLMLVMNTLSYGGILLYTFLAVNFYKADKKHVTHWQIPFKHIDYYHADGSWIMANVDIEYKSIPKSYNIPATELPQGEFHSFNMGIAPGYWGYDVVESREPMK